MGRIVFNEPRPPQRVDQERRAGIKPIGIQVSGPIAGYPDLHFLLGRFVRDPLVDVGQGRDDHPFISLQDPGPFRPMAPEDYVPGMDRLLDRHYYHFFRSFLRPPRSKYFFIIAISGAAVGRLYFIFLMCRISQGPRSQESKTGSVGK